MLGGAEGSDGTSPQSNSTWINLFNNWNDFYPLLIDLINEWNINGIDLDFELSSQWQDGTSNFDNVCKLLKNLNTDFGNDFLIVMAPVAEAIYMNDINGGLSGFDYKYLMDSEYGKYISWLNLQFYNGWGSLDTPGEYEEAVDDEGYDPSLLGMCLCMIFAFFYIFM